MGVRAGEHAPPDAPRAIVAGGIHAFRLPRERWPSYVARAADLGCTHILVPVPWGEHEPTAGEFEFGERRPSLDLARFLDVVADQGLRAFVRVGPRLRAELSHGGLPEHVVWDKALMARSPRGNPVLSPMPPRMFPWPSVESEAYATRIDAYFAALAGVVRPRLAPRGIVESIDVEDASSIVLRAGVYARDYHPDAIAAFRRFLVERYGDVGALSKSWGVNVARFEDVNPPTRFAAHDARDLPRHLDWAHHQERSVHAFRLRVLSALDRAGLTGVPRGTCLDANALSLPTRASRAASVVERVGVELTTRMSEASTARRRIGPVSTTSERPFARVVLGGAPFGRPRTERDSVESILLALAHGARELELTGLVEHERCWGAPIDEHGEPQGPFAALRALLTAVRTLPLSSLRRDAEIRLVVPDEYVRFARATHLFGPFGAGLLDFVGRSFSEATRDGTFGLKSAVAPQLFERIEALERAMDALALPFEYGDVGSLARRPPRVAIVPTFDFLVEETRAAMKSAMAAGVRVLGGPLVPSLDGAMNAARLEGLEVLPDGDAALLEAIDELARAARLERTPRDASSGAHALPLNADGTRTAWVSVNPSETLARLALPDDVVDAVTGDVLTAGTHHEVRALSARLFRVVAPGASTGPIEPGTRSEADEPAADDAAPASSSATRRSPRARRKKP